MTIFRLFFIRKVSSNGEVYLQPPPEVTPSKRPGCFIIDFFLFLLIFDELS